MIDVPSLKVGTRVDIVFENEIAKSNAHYMKALVYDFEKNKIILSQTSPALNRHFIKRRIMITFLVTIERRVLRFGFPAVMMDIITNYQIASGTNVEALIVKQYKDPEPVDFRMYFRVRPSSQSNINIFLKEEKVNLIDISLGGAKFTYPKTYLFGSADEVMFKLIIGGAIFSLDAKVHEVWSSDDNVATRNLQYVSVEFHHLNKQLEASLGKAIIDIERQRLSEGKI
jgi:hypothetical protein